MKRAGFSKNKISGTKNFSSLVTEDRVLYEIMHLVRTTTLVNDRFCSRRKLNEIGIFFWDQRNRSFRKFENQAYYVIIYIYESLNPLFFRAFRLTIFFIETYQLMITILINKNYMINNVN